MSKDLTQKLNGSLEDKIDRLITIVQSMDSRIESVDSKIESIGPRIESIASWIETIDSRLSAVEDRLGRLETKVEERLKDTRPMWEVVQTQLAEIRESQDRLRGEMEKGFRLVDRRLESQPVEYDKLSRYHRDLEERVEKIEKQLS
jgi:chromosome segregation ATPase